MKKFFLYLLPLFCFVTSVHADRGDTCDPVVQLGQQVNTLQQALSALAGQYGFELSFPVNADHSVESVEGMRLSQALKYLTSDVNTVLRHEKSAGCEMARLVSMEVLPVGEEGEYVHVKPQVQAKPKVEPVYIDNMELYAEEVLLKQRKRDNNLSPEQRKEFREVKKLVRQQLEDEGLLELKQKKNRKNNKRKFREQAQEAY